MGFKIEFSDPRDVTIIKQGGYSISQGTNLSFSFLFHVQSNLCTATTLATKKKWPLFRGGCYSEGSKYDIWEVEAIYVITDNVVIQLM